MYHPLIQKFERTHQYHGEIHGQLIVEKLTDKTTYTSNNRYWNVYCCKCGEFKEVLSQSLKNGIEMCYDCNPNCKGGKGVASIQQQMFMNQGKFLPNGEEAK